MKCGFFFFLHQHLFYKPRGDSQRSKRWILDPPRSYALTENKKCFLRFIFSLFSPPHHSCIISPGLSPRRQTEVGRVFHPAAQCLFIWQLSSSKWFKTSSCYSSHIFVYPGIPCLSFWSFAPTFTSCHQRLLKSHFPSDWTLRVAVMMPGARRGGSVTWSRSVERKAPSRPSNNELFKVEKPIPGRH